ncbi:MAG: N-glycosylase [Nanoarchaeota archaeon]|nr:N-glycosylase [Nanoarchaeota archaeon]
MDLLSEYTHKSRQIKDRLNLFKRFYTEDAVWAYSNGSLVLVPSKANANERLFEEMCFCILAANGTAVSSMKAVEASRHILMEGSVAEIQAALRSSGVRFHNRAEYIVYNRENLKKDYGFDIKGLVESYPDRFGLRNYLALYIKGFGYKEASHFLRNIGISGLAILDKHILRSMHELGIIPDVPKSLARRRYLETEQAYLDMSRSLKIDPDELDLLLWSIKNGQILK